MQKLVISFGVGLFLNWEKISSIGIDIFIYRSLIVGFGGSYMYMGCDDMNFERKMFFW